MAQTDQLSRDCGFPSDHTLSEMSSVLDHFKLLISVF